VTTLEEVRVLVGQSAVALSQALGYRGVDESNP
jgi:hypothetical protein